MHDHDNEIGEDLQQLLDGIGETAGGSVIVYRIRSDGRSEMVRKYAVSDFDPAAVAEDVGGGRYRAQVRNAGGKIIGSRNFDVAEDFPRKRAAIDEDEDERRENVRVRSKPAEPAADPLGLQTMVPEVMKQLLLDKLRGGPTSSPAFDWKPLLAVIFPALPELIKALRGPRDQGPTMRDLLELVKEKGSASKGGLSEAMELMRFMRELEGERGGSGGGSGLGEMLPTLLEAVAQGFKGNGAAAGGAGHATGVAAGQASSPATNVAGDQVGDESDMALLRAMVRRARKGKRDPRPIVDYVASVLGDEYVASLALMGESLIRTFLTQIDPERDSFTDALVEELMAFGQEEPEEDAEQEETSFRLNANEEQAWRDLEQEGFGVHELADLARRGKLLDVWDETAKKNAAAAGTPARAGAGSQSDNPGRKPRKRGKDAAAANPAGTGGGNGAA